MRRSRPICRIGQFRRLLETLGLEDGDGRFATNPGRLSHRGALTEWLGAAIAKRSRDDLVAALVAADVPAGPVLSVGEAVDAMQRAYDGEWLQEMEGVRLAPNPILVDGERMPLRILPPRFGQHTTEVLEELGFDGPAIAEFYRAEVVR